MKSMYISDNIKYLTLKHCLSSSKLSIIAYQKNLNGHKLVAKTHLLTAQQSKAQQKSKHRFTKEEATKGTTLTLKTIIYAQTNHNTHNEILIKTDFKPHKVITQTLIMYIRVCV